MSKRIEKLKKMAEHTVFAKMIYRLSESEFDECVEFIEEHDHLDQHAFAYAVNRWKLDQPKTKHHTDMWALVLQSN